MMQVKVPQRLGSSMEDVHAMVECKRYEGVPGSGAAGAQPFTVRVSVAPLLLMDFHAHLCLNEVIGILKGTWDEDRRLITCALPFMDSVPMKVVGIWRGSYTKTGESSHTPCLSPILCPDQVIGILKRPRG